ncbi:MULTISPECIES: hypothetical protein [Bacillota]|uniref:hypothetical protein n=1 Tax=Bacillota TaxID=1239 RepID=UPI0039F0EB5E
MKLYSFSLVPGEVEEFKKIIPPFKSKKIFRNFLLNEYVLPESLVELQKETSNPVVQPYRMTDAEINKIDLLIGQAKAKGHNLSRSAVMRNIIQNLIDRYKDNPIQKSEQVRQTFKLPSGTKARIEKLVQDGSLTYELSSFIMDEYVPSNDFPSMRNQEQEDLNFKSDKEVFDKLDEIASEYGFKKGGRAKIFRDALSQFESSMADNSPKKTILEQQLQKVIENYKEIENSEVIKESINKYLND